METEKAIENIKRAMNEHLAVEECTICFTNDLAIILKELEKKDKMIDKMADEILDLNSMIAEKSEFFSVVPIWLGKEHIKEYFKGITNKKVEESE